MKTQQDIPDISTPDDVALLVRRFYDLVYADELLGPIFVETAKVDFEEHLPIMEGFWATILFGEPRYRGNPMAIHHRLDEMTPLTSMHFRRWLLLFHQILDGLFAGPTTERARAASIQIARNIEMTLQYRRESFDV